MKDNQKTKGQLIHELSELRSQNAELIKSITGMITAELAAEAISHYAESIVETVREPLLVLDADLKIISANRNFYRTFKVNPGETIGSFIYDLGNKQWDIPVLLGMLEKILPGKEAFEDFEVTHDFQGIGHKVMLLNARQVYRKDIDARMILLAIEDITERKRLEDLLADSEEQYRRLFETASDGIVLLEKREGKITQVNQATEKLLGYTEKESIGNKLQDIGVVLGLDDFQTIMQNLNTRGILKYDNVSVKPKSGQHIDTDIYFVDKAKLVQCNIRDVTERKRAEETLRRSEEIYRLVVDNMADVITIMDLNLRFTYVSPSIIRLRGFTAEEVMSQTMEQVMTPESLQVVAKAFEEEMKLEAGGTADPTRTRILELEEYRKDGSSVWLENHMSALRDKEKNLIGIITLSSDITQRKQAEDKIKIQTDAMESAIDGMALLDKNGGYIYLNQAHARIYGYENAGELIGKSWRTLYDADEIERFDAEIMPNFGQKGYWQGQALGMKKDGSKFPQEISLTVLGSGGLICIIRDITARKWAEDHINSLLASVQEEKTKLSALINSITDEVWFADINKKFTIVNPIALKNFCIEPDKNIDVERLAKGFEVLRSNGTARPLEEAPPLRALSGEVVANLEEIVRIPFSGEFRYRQVSAAPVRDAAGNIVGSVSVVRDITGSKKVEEELWASKAQLTNALEMAHLGHWEYDVANDLFTFNDQFYKIFHTTAEQVGGYTMHAAEYARRFVHPDDIYMVGEETRKAIETTDLDFNRQIEHRMLYADGTVGYINVRFFIVKDSHGRTVKTYGVNQDITERKQAEDILKETLERLRKAVNTTIQVMVAAVEVRDPYTSGHQTRSTDLARAIAAEMGMSPEKIECIRIAGSIHDIGKLSIPAEILSKPTKLSDIEFSLIKEHSLRGYEMLKDVESPWPLAQIVYQHHERMNGSGYPRNLKGEEILIEARILSVADVVEAMASHRPYRPSLGIDEALEEISKNRGILYDPEAVAACVRLFNEKGYKFR